MRGRRRSGLGPKHGNCSVRGVVDRHGLNQHDLVLHLDPLARHRMGSIGPVVNRDVGSAAAARAEHFRLAVFRAVINIEVGRRDC